MNSFLKMFLASCLGFLVGTIALVLIGFFFIAAMVTAIGGDKDVKVANKSVLTIDLAQHYKERMDKDPFAAIAGGETESPGLYDAIRVIRHAATDDNIKGIYINANGAGNGYASSEELRNALLDFKKSKKFVIAYGDVISQGAYFIASAAGKVYCNPVGAVDWSGFNADLLFLKGTLDRLKIEPQIFYAGKFKSATEPLRTTEMTPENKLQTKEWLGDLYQHFLMRTSQSRGIDTATLFRLANTGAIQTPQDALSNKLVDGLKYDDEVKDEIKKTLGIDRYSKINFISLNKYANAVSYKKTGGDRIGLIYAEGDIVDGKGGRGMIGSEEYVKLVRTARLDKSIKAIVFRINSGGGSALASENIWRELSLAKAEKPVVVSFGDVAASGGYYIAAAADSIFALPNTITGSIGVFGIIPNMQGFFNDKLGITFDGVKTAEYADLGAVYRPLTAQEKAFIQQGVDRIYLQFKQRVAQGRKKDIAYIDSIAQGRVWSGVDGLRLGLVDRIGGLQAAVESAAKLAKLKDYRLREYPAANSWLDNFFETKKSDPELYIKEKMGAENYLIYQQLSKVKQMCGTPQARMPFQFFIR